LVKWVMKKERKGKRREKGDLKVDFKAFLAFYALISVDPVDQLVSFFSSCCTLSAVSLSVLL